MNAIPEKIIDIRDGLSIVDRTILSAIVEMLPCNGYYRRSSKVISQIEERYSLDPDESYERIVEFAHGNDEMYLVDGHGNFSFFPAAPNFSECRSSPFLQYLSESGFISGENEPFDMPLPFLLLCGTPGFGDNDTKIATHDLRAVMNAVFALINDPTITNKELAHIIGGPTLYVGGTIINTDELPEIYEKGYGEICYSISRKTLNPDCWGSIKENCEDFCRWYGHKLTKPAEAKRGYYEITIQYNAFLTDGTEARRFSLKEILETFICQYKNLISKHYGPSLDNNILYNMLLSEIELLKSNYAPAEHSRQNNLYKKLTANNV